MTTEQILEEITSRNTDKVYRASWEVIDRSQQQASIMPLVPHLEHIKKKTDGLDMGGYFAPNQRFVDQAIRTIEFYRNGAGCSCSLYTGLDVFDPQKEKQKGNVEILDIIIIKAPWIDHYHIACRKCGTQYKVTEGESHYSWWNWEKYDGSEAPLPMPAPSPVTHLARHISISINKPASKVYQFVGDPNNLPKWVAFVQSIRHEQAYHWRAETDLGSIGIDFPPQNGYGIVDHTVTLPDGSTVSNPLRVMPNGEGSELVFTVFHMPGRTDYEFDQDARSVEADLKHVKDILEAE